MLRVRIDRHTNMCSPTRHKWLKLVWNSNLRMFFWLIQKRAIYISCGISNLICSRVSFYISDCISLFNLSTQSVQQSLLEASRGERWRNQPRFTFQQKAFPGYQSVLLSCSVKSVKKNTCLARMKIFPFVGSYVKLWGVSL